MASKSTLGSDGSVVVVRFDEVLAAGMGGLGRADLAGL